jgi:hypothetical protein
MHDIIRDTPVMVIHDPLNPQTPYVIIDAKGVMHAQFVTQEEANAFVEAVNAPEPEPALPEEPTNDTADEHDQGDRDQQKEETMPRGIPKKKTAKKSAFKKAAKKRATSAVKKTAKKVAKKVADRVTKKKKKKRATPFKY